MRIISGAQTMKKIASSVGEVVRLVLFIVVALAIGGFAVATTLWFSGVLYGLFAYLVTKMFGFDAVPSMNWFIGGTVAAALTPVGFAVRAWWTNRKGKKD